MKKLTVTTIEGPLIRVGNYILISELYTRCTTHIFNHKEEYLSSAPNLKAALKELPKLDFNNKLEDIVFGEAE
jgi:hypothetical protein